eukprot:TRINITY_DN50483_c0_g1_i1.p1 TRINITY_DN50483_c0_g1~~TRINITY_DN50483_c0_g1_i1.p1  ORF type:complete len:349 (+),score=145.65 TRINITY_DN50483_c0_g1_i1:180-1226(+)
MADKGHDGFEGPEKKFEIDFRRRVGTDDGLFSVSDETWQRLLDKAHCTIIGKEQSAECKMYVLSESSLFVYKRRLIIKTCGITTLMEFIPPLLSLVSTERNDWNADVPEPLGLEVEYASFSRKNFVWPERQPHCHSSFQEEIVRLEKMFPGGSGYILGPLNKEHWNFFVADYTTDEDKTQNPPDQTLEVIMSGLSIECMSHFFNEDGSKTAEGVTESSGISKIIPGSLIDAKLFEPCGYSMNGLTSDNHYWTIHITPEDHCSFVSFETNLPQKDYAALIERVIATFGPTKCFVTLFADNHSLASTPTEPSFADNLPKELKNFTTNHKTVYDFSEPYKLTLLDYTKRDS